MKNYLIIVFLTLNQCTINAMDENELKKCNKTQLGKILYLVVAHPPSEVEFLRKAFKVIKPSAIKNVNCICHYKKKSISIESYFEEYVPGGNKPSAIIHNKCPISFNHDKLDLQKQCTIVLQLINMGADVRFRDEHGNSALHFAALHGLNKIVDLLIKHNADTTICNRDGHNYEDLAEKYQEIAQCNAENSHCSIM